ncbi:MAG TPA: hypothetical protein VF789_10305 [Thermoanaerobaculia bacterium]
MINLHGFLEGASASITTKAFLHLAAISLFLDSVLAYWFGKNLLSVDIAWIQSRAQVGTILIFLTIYVLVKVWLLPFLRLLFGMPFFLGSEYLIRRFFKDFRFGVRDDDFLAFAIASNNAVAHDEYKRLKAEQVDMLEYQGWAIAFFILIGANLAIAGKAPTILQEMRSVISGLPPPWHVLAVLALVPPLFMLLIFAVALSRFHGRYFPFVNRELLKAMDPFLERESETERLEGQLTPSDVNKALGSIDKSELVTTILASIKEKKILSEPSPNPYEAPVRQGVDGP